MTDEITQLPPTLAQLPFFASGRFPKPDLLGPPAFGIGFVDALPRRHEFGHHTVTIGDQHGFAFRREPHVFA